MSNYSNQYRVDRVSSRTVVVPCGINSILYMGNSWEEAKEAFAEAKPYFDTWDQPNILYGVILSVWDEDKNDYVIKLEKGLEP
jgi:hypothetical protein